MALISEGVRIYAGSKGAGVFVSENAGGYWTQLPSGLLNKYILSLGTASLPEGQILKKFLLAGTEGGGVFISDDGGSSWSSYNSKLKNSTVQAFIVNGSTIFAGTAGAGVYRSSDAGQNWVAVNEGLNNPYIYDFVIKNNRIFVATKREIFHTSNNGDTWEPRILNLPLDGVRSLAAVGNYLFAGTVGHGVYRSIDNGGSWRAVNTGMSTATIYSLLIKNSTIFAGSGNGRVFRSDNWGESWTPSSTFFQSPIVNSLTANDSCIFAGTSYGTYMSTDNGLSWQRINALGLQEVVSLSAVGPMVIAGTATNGIYFSENYGKTWSQKNTGLEMRPIYSVLLNDTYAFAGVKDRGCWCRPLTELVTEVKDAIQQSPQSFTLYQNYPNPFNGETIVSFTLPVTLPVELKIYDLLGNEVAVICNQTLAAGTHQIRWQAKGICSGTYFYRLKAGDWSQTKRMVYIR